MANVKLSQIASGGAFVVATDNIVTVRSGTTDVLTTLGTLATQNGTFSGTSSGTNTGDQTITLTGDVTGSGTGSFATTLKNTGTAGTYGQVTTDAQGRVTTGGTNDVAHGGTGAATLTAHAVLLGEGTSTLGFAAIGTSGRVLTDNGAGSDPSFTALATAQIPANLTKADITFNLDGGGVAIVAGGVWYLSNINFAGAITAWNLVADVSGSVVIDVWKANAAIPTVANTITASALPTLASAQSAFAGAITSWTTSIAAGDVFAFKVNSAATVTKVSLTIQVTKT